MTKPAGTSATASTGGRTTTMSHRGAPDHDAVTAAAGRPVSFVSFTVPQYQRDESYFAPLAGLSAGPDTELNFALVPYHPAE